MRRTFILLAIALLCVPLVGGAQGTSRDSTIARAIKTARDSVACVVAPKSAADRCSRARLRLDSLRAAVQCTVPLRPTIPAGGWFCPATAPPGPAPVDSIEVVWPGPIARVAYASGTYFGDGVVDTACAILTYNDSTRKVGWPPIQLTKVERRTPTGAVVLDSATLAPLNGSRTALCGRALQGVNVVADSVPVWWRLAWFTYDQKLFRPVAWIAPPLP